MLCLSKKKMSLQISSLRSRPRQSFGGNNKIRLFLFSANTRDAKINNLHCRFYSIVSLPKSRDFVDSTSKSISTSQPPPSDLPMNMASVAAHSAQQSSLTEIQYQAISSEMRLAHLRNRATRCSTWLRNTMAPRMAMLPVSVKVVIPPLRVIRLASWSM